MVRQSFCVLSWLMFTCCGPHYPIRFCGPHWFDFFFFQCTSLGAPRQRGRHFLMVLQRERVNVNRIVLQGYWSKVAKREPRSSGAETRATGQDVPQNESETREHWSRMCRNESYWSRRCRNESLGQGGAHDQFVPSHVFFTHFQTNALGFPMDSPSAFFFHSFAMMPNAL